MSTEVAAPVAPAVPVTNEEPVTLAPVSVDTAAPAEQVAGSSPELPAPAVTEEHPTAPVKEEHKKRSPFGDLKNKLFHKVGRLAIPFFSLRQDARGNGACALEGDFTCPHGLKWPSIHTVHWSWTRAQCRGCRSSGMRGGYLPFSFVPSTSSSSGRPFSLSRGSHPRVLHSPGPSSSPRTCQKEEEENHGDRRVPSLRMETLNLFIQRSDQFACIQSWTDACLLDTETVYLAADVAYH